MSDVLDVIKSFRLVIPMNRPIHAADDQNFTGTDLACIAKLVTTANRAGLNGLKLQSLKVNKSGSGEIQFEFSWE